MKHLLNFLLVFASMGAASLAHAQQAKVIKVKGQQAIVQFPNGTAPMVGQTIDLNGGGEGGGASMAAVPGSREHLIALSMNLGAYSSSAGGSRTEFALVGRYGWNMKIMEFGPIVQLGYLSLPGQSTRTIGGGGYFDFNFVENNPGVPFIYGVGAEAFYKQLNTSYASGATDSTEGDLELIAAGNVKWFGLNDHIALRGDAGLDIQRSSVNSGATTTLTGLLIRGGIAVYF